MITSGIRCWTDLMPSAASSPQCWHRAVFCQHSAAPRLPPEGWHPQHAPASQSGTRYQDHNCCCPQMQVKAMQVHTENHWRDARPRQQPSPGLLQGGWWQVQARWRRCRCRGRPSGPPAAAGFYSAPQPSAPTAAPFPAAVSAHLHRNRILTPAESFPHESLIRAGPRLLCMLASSCCIDGTCANRERQACRRTPGPTASWKRHQWAQLVRYCSGHLSSTRALQSS